MEYHLNRIAVLFAAYSLATLVLSSTPGLTYDIVKVQKQLKTDNGARIVLYDGNQAVVWDSQIKDSSTISLSLEGDGSFTITNRENQKALSTELKAEDYRGRMVRMDGDNSQEAIVWLVGADGKRRLIPNWQTYKCLKGTGLEDPISVSTKILEQLPNIESAWASCGTNMMRPNEALQRGSYLQAGDYKLLLTDRDLVQTVNGNQVWSTNAGAAQLILQTDGNLVEYDSEYKPVWSSRTYGRTAGFLILGDDGTLRLYDGEEKQVWEP